MQGTFMNYNEVSPKGHITLVRAIWGSVLGTDGKIRAFLNLVT